MQLPQAKAGMPTQQVSMRPPNQTNPPGQQVFVRPSSTSPQGNTNPMPGRWPNQVMLPQGQGSPVTGRPPNAQSGQQQAAPRPTTQPAAGSNGQLTRSQAPGLLPYAGNLSSVAGRWADDPRNIIELDPDQDPNHVPSPGGSLVSSVTTLETSAFLHSHPRGGHGPGLHVGAAYSIEALSKMESITAKVEELDLLPARLDEATTSLRADIRKLFEAAATSIARTEALEQTLRDQSSQLLSAQKAADQALKAELNDHFAEGLSSERETRQEVAEELRSLAREQKILFQQEIERLRDSVMREMRERMDGQKVLREEVQLLQGSLLRLTGRLEESLVELRTELPRLGQEQAGQRADLERLREAVGIPSVQGSTSLSQRLDQAEKSLREQREQRLASEADLRQDFRELLQNESLRQEHQLTGLREHSQNQFTSLQDVLTALTEELHSDLERHSQASDAKHQEVRQALSETSETIRKERDDSFQELHSEIHSLEEKLERITEDFETKQAEATAPLHERLDNCQEELQLEREARQALEQQLSAESVQVKDQFQQQCSSLEQGLSELDESSRSWTDKRYTELESSLQAWVEESVSGRVTILDKTLRKEMSERASTNEQVLVMITHNSERWCQLQAKFDELLVSFQRGFLSAGSSPHGATTPVAAIAWAGTSPENNGVSLVGRSAEDRWNK